MASSEKNDLKIKKVNCKTFCDMKPELNERDSYFLIKKYGTQSLVLAKWEEIIKKEKLVKK